MQETQVQFLGQEDPLEEGMTIHSSILAWRFPWTKEPGNKESDMTEQWGTHTGYVEMQGVEQLTHSSLSNKDL